ncbi:MAG TPA: zinc ribbon domain-containing protein, partial [Steroidobacteraceae bacterium]|nr:zinc ribbon domain-containing protein [Steroidobacteraceae bacterium]
MPFYEYECSSCKYYVEVMQKITDAPLRKCPSCGKSALIKLISAPVFRLKGGGWYETDFKSDKEARRNLAGEDKPDSGEAKPGAGDSKPAAGGESKAAGEGGSAAQDPGASKSSAGVRTTAASGSAVASRQAPASRSAGSRTAA